MPIYRNTFQGLLGVTTTSAFGVWSIDELIDAPLLYNAPTVVSTASTDNATTITLPSGITSGNVIVIFPGTAGSITTTSMNPYTRLQGFVGQAVNGSVYYKLADGTESGTSLRVTDDAAAFGCVVLGRGSPDIWGTFGYSGAGNAAPVAGSITPFKSSLIFLSSHIDATAADPTNTGGFTNVVIDETNGAGGAGAADFYLWSKVSDGTATGDVTVNWNAARATANMCSFEKTDLSSRTSATLISTSAGTGSTMTLGTVNSGNLIFLFLSGRTTPVSPSGFTNSNTLEDNPDIVYAYKIADGTETTLTGTWDCAASIVVDGKVSGVSPTLEVTTTAVSSTLTLPTSSLCAYWSVIDNTSALITTPPSGWTERQNPTGSQEKGYLYTREITTAGITTATATWNSIVAKNSVLVSFYK